MKEIESVCKRFSRKKGQGRRGSLGENKVRETESRTRIADGKAKELTEGLIRHGKKDRNDDKYHPFCLFYLVSLILGFQIRRHEDLFFSQTQLVS